MSNFVHQLDDNEAVFQSTIIGVGSPINLAENGADGSTPSNTRSKRKRNLPGNPDPDAEVVALSPTTLMATNRYICEVCHKGFRRDQNLQLHRRGHNLPWKLKQKANAEVKKRVFVCPDPNCVHHDPSRALGDLTGIKKHFCRKHGEKKWKCHKCSKRYAVQSDWKAHTKICGTRDYHCDCGTIFSRKDSFVTHRAFCEAITEEHYKVNNQNHIVSTGAVMQSHVQELFTSSLPISSTFCSNPNEIMDNSPEPLSSNSVSAGILDMDPIFDPRTNASPMEMASSYKSATALLQKATTVGAKISNNSVAPLLLRGFTSSNSNSFNCVHEGYPVVGSGLASITATTNNGSSSSFPLSVGHQEPRHGYAHIIQSGMSESPLFVISDDENYGNQLAAEEIYRNRCEKMTVDFLGVKLAGHSGIHKKTSYEDNNMGLRDLSMQQSLHNLHS